jgi:peptide/nickel transport system permease protein
MAGSPSLKLGATLGFAALAAAVLAPILASEAPWLARVNGNLCSPALAQYPGAAWAACSSKSSIDWRARPLAGSVSVLLDAPVPFGPEATDLDAVLLAPGAAHYLGTDSLGRDVLSRVVHGFPVALLVGGFATLLSLLLGLLLGGIAGLARRWLDLHLTRLMDLMACFPTLILALALAAAASRPGLGSLIAAIGLTRWSGIARFFRSEVLRQRDLSYIDAARAAGAGRPRLVTRHFLPNSLAPILVMASFSVGHAILLESGMSFLGVGVPPGTASWGGILAEAQKQVTPAWWLVLFPSLALFLTVLACNLVAEGFRESTDPRLSRLG